MDNIQLTSKYLEVCALRLTTEGFMFFIISAIILTVFNQDGFALLTNLVLYHVFSRLRLYSLYPILKCLEDLEKYSTPPIRVENSSILSFRKMQWALWFFYCLLFVSVNVPLVKYALANLSNPSEYTMGSIKYIAVLLLIFAQGKLLHTMVGNIQRTVNSYAEAIKDLKWISDNIN